MKIADRWFDRRNIGDGITLLWEPHVHPFLRCNIWHVRGTSSDLLIDTGLGVASLASEIADLIDKPLTAVATHIHYDHVGSMHEFDERVIHELEGPRLTEYREFASLALRDFPSELLASFVEPEFDEYLLSARPDAGFSVDRYHVHGARPTRLVDEGDVVDLGNRHFEILHLPGHSPGSMGLYEAATGTLFSGDAIYDGLLLDQLPDSNITDYITTMRRLRDLPVTVVHGGHEKSFDRERLIQLVDAYLAHRV